MLLETFWQERPYVGMLGAQLIFKAVAAPLEMGTYVS